MKFGDTIFISLAKLVLQEKTNICATIKVNLLLHCRKFLVLFIVAIVRHILTIRFVWQRNAIRKRKSVSDEAYSISDIKNRCYWQTFQVPFYRSSHSSMFLIVGALKKSTIFTGKRLWWSLFLIKLQGWRLATSLKRDFSTFVFLWMLWNI